MGPLERQMQSYILRAHKDSDDDDGDDDDDDDKGHKNNIWTLNSYSPNVTLHLHYKDLSANAL